jgi:hypothetical protein
MGRSSGRANTEPTALSHSALPSCFIVLRRGLSSSVIHSLLLLVHVCSFNAPLPFFCKQRHTATLWEKFYFFLLINALEFRALSGSN